MELCLLLVAKYQPFIQISSRDETIEHVVRLVKEGCIERDAETQGYDITAKGEDRILTLVEELYCGHKTP